MPYYVRSPCEICTYALRLASFNDTFISCLKDTDQTEELMDEECADFELDPNACEAMLIKTGARKERKI